MGDINDRLMWLNGKILPVKDAMINVMSPTSQFGANVFEGIRCYWNEEQQELYTFRLEDHYKRLLNSIKMLRMNSPYTVADFQQGLVDVVRANNYKEDIAVRQTVFVDGFGSWSSKEPIGMFIAPIPKKRISAEYNKVGLNCCISSWRRIDDNSLSPRIKCGANYINSRMAQLEALNNGYDTAIFLNKNGNVAEGPGSCLFMVKNGELVTPALTENVLESITRDTVLKIAKDILHLKTVERNVNRTELYTCDEAFLCGSAMEITPVITVDKMSIGMGTIGCITNGLHKEYLRIVRGEENKYRKWLTPIYGAE